MVHLNAPTAGLSLGSGRHSKAGRKKKTRVVNLRRKADSDVGSEEGDLTMDSASVVWMSAEAVSPQRGHGC